MILDRADADGRGPGEGRSAMEQGCFEVTEHGGIDPSAESARFVAKHLSAYHFAARHAGPDVLEIGFGDGYGASFLASRPGVRQVHAVDLFEANVERARRRYPDPALAFSRMDATQLTFPDRSFDLVVSFQVVEHIPSALLPDYARQIRRVLKPGGAACLSTLNLKKNRKPGRPYEKSPHHDREFEPREYGDFLGPFFSTVEMYGLYPTPSHALFERAKKLGVFRALPARLNPVDNFYGRIGVRDFRWRRRSDLDGCIDLMAVCRAA